MAKTDEQLPEDFLVYLQKNIPGFASEAPAHQWALASMVWYGSHKRRRHSHFEGAMSFSHQELAESFGRKGFKAINERLGFFRLSSNYSMTEGFTKGYWLSERVEKVYRAYKRRWWRKATELLWVRGTKIVPAQTIRPAIASTDTNGKAVSTVMWKGAKSLNLVPVDIEALKRLRKWLEMVLDQYADGAPMQPDLLMPYPRREDVERLHESAVKILRHASTNLAGVGHINQRYAIAPSGRLYARGVSLQAAHTLIKQAALHGLWEYDFSNCHFALVSQMSAQAGYRCEAIEHYTASTANKEATRAAIAGAAGISVEQVKEALLATMYGARESTRDEDAIPEAIGKEAALRLYGVPEFQRLKADIATARALILKKWPRTANGRLSNACGKAISPKEPATRRLAHLVQGAEAKALMVAVNMHPHHIVLLQHDGFTATTRLDPRAIERAVLAELGYRLELEEKQLQMDPRAQFLKTRSKSEIARRAKPGAGLEKFGAS